MTLTAGAATDLGDNMLVLMAVWLARPAGILELGDSTATGPGLGAPGCARPCSARPSSWSEPVSSLSACSHSDCSLPPSRSRWGCCGCCPLHRAASTSPGCWWSPRRIPETPEHRTRAEPGLKVADGGDCVAHEGLVG